MLKYIGDAKIESLELNTDLLKSISNSSYNNNELFSRIKISLEDTSIPAIISPLKRGQFYLTGLGGFLDDLNPFTCSTDNCINGLNLIKENILLDDKIKNCDIYLDFCTEKKLNEQAYTNWLQLSLNTTYEDYIKSLFPNSKKLKNNVLDIEKSTRTKGRSIYFEEIELVINDIKNYYSKYTFNSNWNNLIYLDNLINYFRFYSKFNRLYKITSINIETGENGCLYFSHRLNDVLQIPILYGEINCMKACILEFIQFMFLHKLYCADFMVGGDELKRRYGFIEKPIFFIKK